MRCLLFRVVVRCEATPEALPLPADPPLSRLLGACVRLFQLNCTFLGNSRELQRLLVRRQAILSCR